MKQSKDDEEFNERLVIGNEGEQLVWNYLSRRGLQVGMPAFVIRRPKSEAKKFKDQKDITFFQHVFEVKYRCLRFTTNADYPYKTVFIDTVHGQDQKEIKPLLHIVISKFTGAMIVLPGTTSGCWTVKENVYSPQSGTYDDMYECDRKHWVRISRVVPKLLKMQERLIAQIDRV